MTQSNRRSPRLRLSESLSRVRVRSPSFQFKQSSDPLEREQKLEFLGREEEQSFEGGDGDGEGAGNNKVMVVVDSSVEAKAALEWALSHTVQSQDTVVLLHVARSREGVAESNGKVNPKAYELVQAMKNMCQKKRPQALVEIAMVEGKERGELIVEAAKKKRVSLLVLGERKRSVLWRLAKRWKIKRYHGGMVDYCIQNASCMTIAVRRKSNKLGGYLITTKTHKKFWLLA